MLELGMNREQWMISAILLGTVCLFLLGRWRYDMVACVGNETKKGSHSLPKTVLTWWNKNLGRSELVGAVTAE